MAKDSNCVVWSPKMKKWAIISCGTLVVLAATATYLSSCRRSRRRRFGLKEERTPGTKHKAGHESGEIVEGPECKPVGQKEMARRASDHAAVGRWQRETGAAPLQSVSSPSVVEREPKKTGGGGGARERIQSIVSRYSGASQGGIAPHNPNKQNQDALVMAMDRVTSSVFLAVLDGHGQAGRRVSQAFRMRLAEEVFNHPEWRTCCETAITESIAKIEAHVQANIMIDTKSSGTTLVSACLRGTRLTVTNVGDSRAVLGRRLELESGAGKDSSRTMLVAQRLTEDHKPDVQREVRPTPWSCCRGSKCAFRGKMITDEENRLKRFVVMLLVEGAARSLVWALVMRETVSIDGLADGKANFLDFRGVFCAGKW